MQTKNFFKEKSIVILTTIFIILTVANIIYATIVQRGLTFDGLLFFMAKMQYLSQNELSTFWPGRFRYCIVFINNLPITLGYFLFHINSKNILAMLYTLPLFLFPALFTWFNYLLAKRSQRYDIVVWSLFIYALLIIPTQVWPIVESMLAVPVIFLLFHYICADIKYNFWDIAAIILLTVISYSSSEQNIYVGPLLFIIALYYARKTEIKKNKLVKYITGSFCLLMPIGYFIYFMTDLKTGYEYNSVRFFKEIIFFENYSNFYKEPYLFLFISILMFMLLVALKNIKMTKQLIGLFSFFSLIFLYQLFRFHWFYGIEFLQYRVLLFIFPAIIITMIFVTDIFKEKINTVSFKNILTNFLIIILFCGSFNNIVQIMNSKAYETTVNEILTVSEKIAKKDKKTLIVPFKEKEIYKNKHYSYFKVLFEEDYHMSFIPAFSKKYKVNFILYPGKNADKRYKKELSKTFNFYRVHNELWLSFYPISVKNKFWDLSHVAKKAPKRK